MISKEEELKAQPVDEVEVEDENEESEEEEVVNEAAGEEGNYSNH